MSAHKPRDVYLVYYSYEDGPEGGRVVGIYYTFTAAKRACDAYRKASDQRWLPWSITRTRTTGHVHWATTSTVTVDSVYDEATETWSTPDTTLTLDIYRNSVDDTTVINAG